MRDNLLDLIQHTCSLGYIDLIKVTGTETETKINALSDDKKVILSGVFKTPHPDFEGIFGMPNLPKLRTILRFDEYDENATINMIRTNSMASAIHFETSSGDFVNDYRLMSQALVEERIRPVRFAGAAWNVQFEPKVNSIQRLKKQLQANNDETTFILKQDNRDLKIYMGNASTHSGNFVFESMVSGKINQSWSWPVKHFISIMDLPGDKVIYISDSPVMKITVDSGLADYEYMIPAETT